MKSQFKLAIYFSFGLMFVLFAIYYNQIDYILEFMEAASEGGTYKLPT